MVERKTGKEFRDSGLLWFINTALHLFGWAIVLDMDTDELYAARVKFRGFDEKTNDKGYRNVSQYLKENAEELLEETEV